MSLFQQGGADNNIGTDIDNTFFSSTTSSGDRVNYGSYDVVKRPIISGSSDNYIIPSNPDLGIPTQQSNGEYGMSSFYDKRQGFNEPIIDDMLLSNNGRVRDVMETGKIDLPALRDNILFHDNKETAVKGLVEETDVSNIFFSDENMESLQMSVRYGVNQRTKQVISKQSEKELYIIMRSIMLQYGNLINGMDNVIEEVKKLNAKVISYCIDDVSSNVMQHVQYLEEISKLPMPMERPEYLNKDNYTYDISNLL
jgi:hypothetical protein